jgi:carboxymethylenebutenolidase
MGIGIPPSACSSLEEAHVPSALATVKRFVVPLALLSLARGAGAQPGEAELVSFPGPRGELRGYLYKPAGAGPFPAILWNHGSERLPGWQPDLAAFFTGRGFAFFLPHRAGHGKSAGRFLAEEVDGARGPPRGDRTMVQTQEDANRDVVAAGEWLLKQPFVNAKSAAMVGCSFGGIQTLLSAEKGLGFKAFIAFAPGAKSWANAALQERLKRAVANARAPVFILQAANDFSTDPVRTLGPIAEKKGGRSKLYPAFGSTAQDGHWAFATLRRGSDVWGADVLEFLRASLKQAAKQ